MRGALVFLAALCVLLGVLPGLVLPTLEGLAPAPRGAAWAATSG